MRKYVQICDPKKPIKALVLDIISRGDYWEEELTYILYAKNRIFEATSVITRDFYYIDDFGTEEIIEEETELTFNGIIL